MKLWEILSCAVLLASVASAVYLQIPHPPRRICVPKTLPGAAQRAVNADGEVVQLDAQRQALGTDLWPGPHGQAFDGSSPFVGPRNVAAGPAWSWHHPQGRFYTVLNGVAIDGASNIFVSSDDMLVKLSPDGATLWTYCLPGLIIPTPPSLAAGAVYVSTADGQVFAVDAITGEHRWKTKVASAVGWDTHTVAAYAAGSPSGLLIAPAEPVSTVAGGTAGGSVLNCLDATSGAALWQFRPDAAVWNFYAVFPGDGTFAYQDLEGRVYRNKLSDGSLIWKRGGQPGTWSDGSVSFGPNGLLYGAATLGPNKPWTPGQITAYRLKDGETVWSQQVPGPANQFSAVGPLGPGRNASVVVATGVYAFTHIFAFDAATGTKQWSLDVPRPLVFRAVGDAEGAPLRKELGNSRPACAPNAWGNPSIDAAGTVYIGHHSGVFLSLHDDNDDGRIDISEVRSFDGGAGFPGSGPALAQGLVVAASCDTVFAFRG